MFAYDYNSVSIMRLFEFGKTTLSLRQSNNTERFCSSWCLLKSDSCPDNRHVRRTEQC